MFGKKKREEDFEEYEEYPSEEGRAPLFPESDGEEEAYDLQSEEPEYAEYEDEYDGEGGSWAVDDDEYDEEYDDDYEDAEDVDDVEDVAEDTAEAEDVAAEDVDDVTDEEATEE